MLEFGEMIIVMILLAILVAVYGTYAEVRKFVKTAGKGR